MKHCKHLKSWPMPIKNVYLGFSLVRFCCYNILDRLGWLEENASALFIQIHFLFIKTKIINIRNFNEELITKTRLNNIHNQFLIKHLITFINKTFHVETFKLRTYQAFRTRPFWTLQNVQLNIILTVSYCNNVTVTSFFVSGFKYILVHVLISNS